MLFLGISISPGQLSGAAAWVVSQTLPQLLESSAEAAVWKRPSPCLLDAEPVSPNLLGTRYTRSRLTRGFASALTTFVGVLSAKLSATMAGLWFHSSRK